MPAVVTEDEGAFGQPQYSQAERGAQIQVEAAPEVDKDGIVVPLTTTTTVIEVQDGSPAEFVDEDIVVDTTQVPTSVPTPQATVPEQPRQVDDAESQDVGTTTTDSPEPVVRVAATPSDAEEVAISESYEPESVPPTTGGITRIDGPATVGEPAVRLGGQNIIDFQQIARSGEGEVIQPSEIDFTCLYKYSALGGTPLHDIEIVVSGLDPFVPRFQGDYQNYKNTGSVGIQLSAPSNLPNNDLSGDYFYYFSQWADEDGEVEMYEDVAYSKSTTENQLRRFDATIKVDQWFTDPNYVDDGSFPDPDNSVTYSFQAECNPL